MAGPFILARHGNTFESGQTPVMVGRRSDLPLTAKGHEQAQALAAGLAAGGLVPRIIVTGPLLRTRQTADHVGAAFSLAPRIDHRLAELDYGAWEGLSDAEVLALDGEAALAGWRDDGLFPPRAGFLPEETALLDAMSGVAADLKAVEGPVLFVSSNGILRFLLWALLAPALPLDQARRHRMKTGHAGLILPGTDNPIRSWDVAPGSLRT